MKILCEIQGSSPLLMNRFTEQSAARISAASGPSFASAGRGTPREQAEPKLYRSADGTPMIPGPNVFRGIVDAGVFHKLNKKQITTQKSSLIPAGIQLVEIECPLMNPFGDQLQWEVDSRSVVNPATGGRLMCHRPRFDSWKIAFTMDIDERLFDESLVRLIVDDFGVRIGLGDYRPARKGPFGRHMVVTWKRQAESKLKASKGVA